MVTSSAGAARRAGVVGAADGLADVEVRPAVVGPRWRAARTVALLLSVVLTAAGCSVPTAPTAPTASTASTAPTAATAGTAARSPTSATTGGAPTTTAPLVRDAVTDRALAQVLHRRTVALADGSLTGWLDPVAGTRLRATQTVVFARLRRMHVVDLRLLSLSRQPTPSPSRPAFGGAAGAGSTSATTSGSPPRSPTGPSTPRVSPSTSTSTLSRPARAAIPSTTTPASTKTPEAARTAATATFGYRFDGFDTSERTFEVDLTFSSDEATPRLLGWAPADRPQPWDLDDVIVRRSATAMVVGAGSPAHLDELVARAEAAAQRVRRRWGSARPTVWVAPASDDEAGRLLGIAPDRVGTNLREVAAVTDGPLVAGVPAGADRIVVVPSAWSALVDAGRDVVLAHELTHVTVRSSTTRPVPLWLSEGFAELVAYSGVDLPEREIARPAIAAVRSHGLPTALPADADFDAASGDLPAAYGLSLLALRTLQQRHGDAAVVRFYRAAAAGGVTVPNAMPPTTQSAAPADPEAVVDESLRRVLGSSRTALLDQWRSRLRALAR